jgi:hypothetical protein
MRPVTCEFEADVLRAVVQSRWPERTDAALREHAASCGICSDVAKVAGTFEGAREELAASATLPDASRVWWTAQMRARREAIKAAGRPITAAQVSAFACAAGLVGACFGATSAWFQAALGRVVVSVSHLEVGTLLSSASALLVENGAFVLAMIAIVFLVPTAVYVAMDKE